MAIEFVWAPDQDQTYTQEYGSQTVTNDYINLWKWGGADFTMDAQGETLTLLAKTVALRASGDNAGDYRWPTYNPGVPAVGSEFKLHKGNLLLTYSKPIHATDSSLWLGGDREGLELMLKMKNDATMSVVNPLLVTMRNNFLLDMSNNSQFSIIQPRSDVNVGRVKTSGQFKLSDNAKIRIDAMGHGYLGDLVIEMHGNSAFQHTVGLTAAIAHFQDGYEDVYSNIAIKLYDNARLSFLVDSNQNIKGLSTDSLRSGPVFYFDSSNTSKDAAITITNATKADRDLLLQKGNIAIDNVPQNNASKLLFSFIEGDMRISLQ